MIIAAYIVLAVLALGAFAFGVLIIRSRSGHKKAWAEYIAHHNENMEKRWRENPHLFANSLLDHDLAADNPGQPMRRIKPE
jgi:hypothetical protein